MSQEATSAKLAQERRTHSMPPQAVAILTLLVVTLAIYFFYLADLR